MGTPFKFIRQFDEYSIVYSSEATKVLKKPYYFTKEAYVYFLGDKFSNRFIFVEKGFFTDGSSTPALFQGILPVWGEHGSAVIAHDKLCETGYVLQINKRGEVERVKLNRKEIDDIFLEMLDVVGTDKNVIRLVRFGFKVHRGFTAPSVPNPNPIKNSYQERHTLANNISNIREEQVFEYLPPDVIQYLYDEKDAA